jgi:hypothetical protein
VTNYLLISDIHLADHPPASRKEGYLDEVMGLLWQTVEVAREYDAVAVWAGDVFHIKTPARNSFDMVGQVIDLALMYPNGLYIVPGNHDITHDRLDSIHAQPLGQLFKHNSIVKLTGLEARNNGHCIYGVPWLQRFTDDNVDNALRGYRETEGCALVVTHAPMYPPGQELKYEYYDTHKWAQYMGNAGSTFYGHVHNPHGVYIVDGVQFCNNGALSRGSLDESNLKRKVVATIWSDLNQQFYEIPLLQAEAKDIFRMEVKASREAQVKLDDFLESIGQTSLAITTSSAVMSHIRSLGLGPEVEALIQELLDSCDV